MENITFVRLKSILVQNISAILLLLVFGLGSSFSTAPLYNSNINISELSIDGKKYHSDFSLWRITGLWNPNTIQIFQTDVDGDGVTCDQENKDGTNPNDPCDFILEHQDCSPSDAWKQADCDGDGVSNGKEKQDGTNPNDPCDFILEHQDCSPSDAWKKADCDGDGVSNGKEKQDGTDPLDPCDFILEHQDCSPSDAWKKADCDGDGVSNGKEKKDGTDPLDPCDFILEHQDCSPSDAWKKADCDGDGVSNGKEKEDGTDPLDPCDFILEHQDCSPSDAWKKADCDGDGVTNEDEKEDGTDPLDPCDYNPESVTLPRSGDYLTVDCDGDGVTNEDEEKDGTDPQDSCDFVLDSQTVDPSSTWNSSDCDGDGVTNEDEKKDGTDPLDPCDYNAESVTLPQTADWKTLDCDGDGNPNGTDPDPLVANASDDYGATPALTEVAINILENDDYLPNNDANNIGVTNLTRIGGDAQGIVFFDNETGFVNYTPVQSESNTTVAIMYQVCNVALDPSVCATATIYVEIGANTLDAVDDEYTTTADEDGTIADSDVLSNDTLNGGAITLADVILSSTPTDQLTINADGSVTVAEGVQAGTYTIEYTICEAANTDNCDTATVTVEVMERTGKVIDAVDDGYTTTAGEDGTIADSDVLSNDTLNGGAITLADVILSSTPTDQLTINVDGSVTVAEGLQPGTYTIEYTICEAANTDNCDTATVTVEVMEGTGNVIDAVDDEYTATAGEDGTIADSDVLSNDSLNGMAITLADVILSSTPTDQLTINADGSVTVAEGVQAGTYTIEYTICEAANTDNCDTATVTVEVMERTGKVIDAVDDGYTTTAGEDGTIADSDVLSNDTLNGGAITLADVILSSTPTDQLTINADGSVTIAEGVQAGTYTIEYTICDVTDIDNCDTATVTVVVNESGNIIDAVGDEYSISGTNGGTIPNSNVLDNDTLNGEPVNASEVILTPDPTNELTINEDGSVTVTPGTPVGSYIIKYTICEVADPTNCDTTTVLVEVLEGTVNVIDAVNDSYNAGTVGGTIPNSDVLDNDTLNGEPIDLADVILTSTPTNELRVNEDGSVTVTPGTESGTYTIEYTICEAVNTDNCDTATVRVVVEAIEVNQMLTPNGDLKNDFLFIRGVEYIKSSTLKIFNRWGTLVFEGKDYDNVSNVFDGRVRGKSALSVNDYLPAGVYFYIFNYQTEQGSFTDSEYIYISR
ncbi:T9SS type B sorting domain-containing protein [Flagellimonas crocea]|uniref:T9SS type B sorting domain-containing protein n=1 Tax=Flagellimonas crocea TaxID=3067311 RepID=UPI00296E4DAB|nr:gliding motility-associated C-terminal domain-containing protein [Muricauda sp. DH64]